MTALDKRNQTFNKKGNALETVCPKNAQNPSCRNTISQYIAPKSFKKSTQSRSHPFRPVTTLDNTPPSSRMQRRPRNSFRAKGQPWGPTFSRKATVEPGMLWPLSLLEKRWKTPSPFIPFQTTNKNHWRIGTLESNGGNSAIQKHTVNQPEYLQMWYSHVFSSITSPALSLYSYAVALIKFQAWNKKQDTC